MRDIIPELSSFGLFQQISFPVYLCGVKTELVNRDLVLA